MERKREVKRTERSRRYSGGSKWREKEECRAFASKPSPFLLLWPVGVGLGPEKSLHVDITLWLKLLFCNLM